MKPLNKEWVEYYKKQNQYCFLVYKDLVYKDYEAWVCAWRLMRDFQNTEVVNPEE